MTETSQRAGSQNALIDALLLAYQTGDPSATATLVRVVSPILLRYYMSQGGAYDYADDFLQEAWLRIHKARGTYREGAPAAPWLLAIARHTRLDLYRKHSRIARKELQVDPLPEPATEAPAGRISGSASKLLDVLPVREREVLTMTKGLGMTLEEVARATASTVGAVKQLSHRAYVRLRTMADRASTGSRG